MGIRASRATSCERRGDGAADDARAPSATPSAKRDAAEDSSVTNLAPPSVTPPTLPLVLLAHPSRPCANTQRARSPSAAAAVRRGRPPLSAAGGPRRLAAFGPAHAADDPDARSARQPRRASRVRARPRGRAHFPGALRRGARPRRWSSPSRRKKKTAASRIRARARWRFVCSPSSGNTTAGRSRGSKARSSTRSRLPRKCRKCSSARRRRARSAPTKTRTQRRSWRGRCAPACRPRAPAAGGGASARGGGVAV